VLHNIGSSFIYILATDTFRAPSVITFHVITAYLLEADVNFIYIYNIGELSFFVMNGTDYFMSLQTSVILTD